MVGASKGVSVGDGSSEGNSRQSVLKSVGCVNGLGQSQHERRRWGQQRCLIKLSAASGELASGTVVARAMAFEGGGGTVEWSATARASALGTAAVRATESGKNKGRASTSGTAAARATAAGGSKENSVRTAAAREATEGL